MEGYQYSHAYDKGGNFSQHESEMRTSLGSPWGPGQGQSGFGFQDPLMQSSQVPDTPYLQTRFSYLKEPDRHSLQRSYSSKRQLFRLLQVVIVRFLVSALSCGAIVYVFILFEKKGVLDQDQKHLFNAIFLGLSLILSMNLISAFKSMAGMIKWRLLAVSGHTLREVDLILGLSSFQKVLELLWTWTRGSSNIIEEGGRPVVSKRWVFRFGAMAWILLGLGAQIDVALIGLTFNHENAFGLQRGPVNITGLERIFPGYGGPDDIPRFSDQKYAAHLYGMMSTNYNTYFETGEGTHNPAGSGASLYRGLNGEWTYWFMEWAIASDDNNQMLSVVTNRSVTVYPECEWGYIIHGQYAEKDMDMEIWMPDNTTQTIPWMAESMPDSTVVVNPIWEEFGPGNQSCGPRCSRLYMFQFLDPANPGYGNFFNCTVTVSNIENADPNQQEHQLPSNTALIIAGAFGSEGWKDSTGRQSSKYSPTIIWGTRYDHDADNHIYAAATLGRFTIGVIAAYDVNGPMVEVMGTQSWIGVTLVVKWRNLYISLGVILLINLCLGIFVAFKANGVYCKDDSYLSTARLLRPLMERLGSSGSVCDGRVLASTFTRRVVYGVRTGNGIHHLDVGEDIQPLNGSFPNGLYD